MRSAQHQTHTWIRPCSHPSFQVRSYQHWCFFAAKHFFLTWALLIDVLVFWVNPGQNCWSESALNKGMTSYEGGDSAFKFLAVLVQYVSLRLSSDTHSRYLRKQSTALLLWSSWNEEAVLSSHSSWKECGGKKNSHVVFILQGRNAQKSAYGPWGQAPSFQVFSYFHTPGCEFSISDEVQMKKMGLGVETFTVVVN